jgi:hypothetical protein
VRLTARNLHTGTTSREETTEEAFAVMREGTECYPEEFPLAVTGKALLT